MLPSKPDVGFVKRRGAGDRGGPPLRPQRHPFAASRGSPLGSSVAWPRRSPASRRAPPRPAAPSPRVPRCASPPGALACRFGPGARSSTHMVCFARSSPSSWSSVLGRSPSREVAFDTGVAGSFAAV